MRHVPIAILLLAFVGLATLYSTVIPLGEGPDEPGHAAYVFFLARTGRLPVQRADARQSDVPGEGHQPPLAYALAVPAVAWLPAEERRFDLPGNARFTWAGGDELNAVAHGSREYPPWRGVVLAWHLARLAPVLCGAVMVICTYLAALAALGRTRRSTAALAAALAALAAAGWDGAAPEQAVRAAVAVTAMAAMAAMPAVAALLVVLLVVLASSVRRGTRMGRIVTSLPRHPVWGTSRLRAPRLRPASATVPASATPASVDPDPRIPASLISTMRTCRCRAVTSGTRDSRRLRRVAGSGCGSDARPRPASAKPRECPPVPAVTSLAGWNRRDVTTRRSGPSQCHIATVGTGPRPGRRLGTGGRRRA